MTIINSDRQGDIMDALLNDLADLGVGADLSCQVLGKVRPQLVAMLAHGRLLFPAKVRTWRQVLHVFQRRHLL